MRPIITADELKEKVIKEMQDPAKQAAEATQELFDLVIRFNEKHHHSVDSLKRMIGNLVENGADVNAITEFEVGGDLMRYNPIRLAASLGDDRVIEALIYYRAVIDGEYLFDGKTTLALAAELNNVAAVEMLVQKGAAINPTPVHQTGALEMASCDGNIILVNRLLALGAVVNARSFEGRTPLMSAIINGHENVIEALLQAGADVNLEDKVGHNAILFASYNGDFKTIKSLVKEHGADVNASNPLGKTPLMIATMNGKNEIASWLLNECDNLDVNATMVGGWTPLMSAIYSDNKAVIKDLLSPKWKSQLNLEIINDEGYDAMSMVEFYLADGRREGYEEIKELLADSPLDISDITMGESDGEEVVSDVEVESPGSNKAQKYVTKPAVLSPTPSGPPMDNEIAKAEPSKTRKRLFAALTSAGGVSYDDDHTLLKVAASKTEKSEEETILESPLKRPPSPIATLSEERTDRAEVEPVAKKSRIEEDQSNDR